MKPAPFAYRDPSTRDEVLALLAEHGDDARVIAGGQTLGPMLNMRVVMPEVLVDLNGVGELDYRHEQDGGLRIGALTRQSALEDDETLAALQPMVADAVPWIAHRPIRNRGTVGGSLSHADPAAEWGALVLALDAELVIERHGAAPRAVPAQEFFQGILTTALEAEDLLAEIRLPPWPAGAGWSFREFARRHGDFALAGAACRIEADADGACTDARIALIGVSDTAQRALDAEERLRGERLVEGLIRECAHRAAAGIEPLEDMHAGADYRRHLARVMVEDALHEARQRIGAVSER